MLLRAVGQVLEAHRLDEVPLGIRCAVTTSTWGDALRPWATYLPRVRELPADTPLVDRSWAAARYWRLSRGLDDEAAVTSRWTPARLPWP